jgi:hypothetical protein
MKKRPLVIEPYRHKVALDPNYAEKTWKILEHAIHEIYNHNASGLSFEELYRFVHDNHRVQFSFQDDMDDTIVFVD